MIRIRVREILVDDPNDGWVGWVTWFRLGWVSNNRNFLGIRG